MMGRTLDETQAALSATELEFWAAFEELYGLPDTYFATGMICTAIVRAIAGGKDVHPRDFVPYLRAADDQAREPQTPAEGRAVLRGILGGFSRTRKSQ